MVAEFDQEQSASDTDTIPEPSAPTKAEDPMATFFGAGNEEPTTTNQNYGVTPDSTGGPMGNDVGSIHNNPVDEDNVDSSGFDFPDLEEPNYSYGNYGGGAGPGNYFWNYGSSNPTDHVSNYGGTLFVDGRHQRPRNPSEVLRSEQLQ